MTRTFLAATLAFGLLVCSGRPAALAAEALIETTAPLADRSEESLKAAVTAAIEKAVRGASAMGFAWIQLRDARVSGNQVAIQILATDDPGEMDEVDPGDGALTEEPGPGVPTPETSRVQI